MSATKFEIKRYSKNFHVIINIDEEEYEVQLDVALVEFLAAMLEQREEDLVNLLALIEFIRLDSSAVKKKKFRKFVDNVEFRENLKVLLESKSVTEIIEDIQDMKYHEIVLYFFDDDKEKLQKNFEED